MVLMHLKHGPDTHDAWSLVPDSGGWLALVTVIRFLARIASTSTSVGSLLHGANEQGGWPQVTD